MTASEEKLKSSEGGVPRRTLLRRFRLCRNMQRTKKQDHVDQQPISPSQPPPGAKPKRERKTKLDAGSLMRTIYPSAGARAWERGGKSHQDEVQLYPLEIVRELGDRVVWSNELHAGPKIPNYQLQDAPFPLECSFSDILFHTCSVEEELYRSFLYGKHWPILPKQLP